MSFDDAPGAGRPRLRAPLRRRAQVRPLELFFDLVFALGFTQCATLVSAGPAWQGVGRGLLVLAVLWWAWAGYAWLTSVVDPDEGPVRIVMFVTMAAMLVVALCVPEAFGRLGLTFALAYGVVRAAHIALFLLAGRDDPGLRRSVLGLTASSAVAIGLLVAASFLDGAPQALLWVLTILIDFGLPALFGVAGWRLVPGHFADRHGRIVILALGISVVALGVGTDGGVDADVITAAVLGVAIAAALWWLYFDVVALVTEQRMVRAVAGRERNALARDSYSYLHLPIVAGIILVAVGLEGALVEVDDPLRTKPALALLGGTAIYLLAHVALRLRNARSVNRHRLVVALVLPAFAPLATRMSPLVALGGLAVLLWAMIGYETVSYGEVRSRLRRDMRDERP